MDIYCLDFGGIVSFGYSFSSTLYCAISRKPRGAEVSGSMVVVGAVK
jgi:hypothetical protein